MSTANFQACLTYVLTQEDGPTHPDAVTTLPNDPGGATKWGITLATYAGYTGRPCTVDDLKAMTPAERDAIYRALFWDKIDGDALPAGVDLMLFDAAVNSGPSRALKQLQEAVDVPEDGRMGPVTLAATLHADPATLIRTLSDARRQFYQSLSTFASFGRGWLARVARTETAALAMAAPQPHTL